LPERLYDDPEELAVWAGRALQIARRKKTGPRARTKVKQLGKAPKPSKRNGRPRS
jgi:DNA transformation protein